uniref:uncharacterized protein LOC122591780 n=1 Tax=Erigeron canadensis TaxID=72917 RepID=UPI001CB93E69|nr:uncharacterized protein LOC122591780 [Erigeron canadensis]
MSIIGGDVESVSPSSTAGSTPATPRNRVKFLCSHGGKILPRPTDGHLKYVGGETRVISVLRDITFLELKKKLTSMFDGEMILKYQLLPEDLDVLVTVKSDEDVRHMVDECDRHEELGAPRLRAFLFPANQVVTVNHLGPIMDHYSLEQRYINCLNGITIHPTSPPLCNNFRQIPVNTRHTTFSISSACSSPRTLPETNSTVTNSEVVNTSLHGKTSSLTRNHSSPSLSNLGCSSITNHQNQIVTANQTNQQLPQSPQPNHFHPHFHTHHHSQPHMSPKPPLDRNPYKTPSGPENIGRIRSEYYKHQMDYSPSSYNVRGNRGGQMHYQRGSVPYDDYYGNYRYDRSNSPPSPDVVSPSHRITSGRYES